MREHVCFLYAQNYSICGLEGMKTTYEKDSFIMLAKGQKLEPLVTNTVI